MSQVQKQKYGPYGAKQEENFSLDLEEDEIIRELVVRSGYYVDAIGFTITSSNGLTDTQMYGGNGGNEYRRKLQGGEYISGISGKAKDGIISKLRIHTNMNPRGYGPYGTRDVGVGFKSRMPLEKGERVSGIFGSFQNYLNSIGLYVEKQSETTDEQPEPVQTIVKHGPYGYHTGQHWSIMLEPCESLRELIIKIGAVVDSITFVTTKTRRKFGGDGGNTEYKVPFQCGEYITNVSGWIGEWQQNRDLTKLKIHTNMCTNGHGYGPFGGGPHTQYLSQFCSQVPSSGRVVGFFGTIHNNYIQSIGLYVKQ